MEARENSTARERFMTAFEKLGLSQEIVCEILGISQKSVSNYMTGKVEPPLKYVEALENYKQENTTTSEPREIRQLENLLWKIGSERPQSREIIQQMLALHERLRSLLNKSEIGISSQTTTEKILQVLTDIRLVPGTDRYNLFKWILERPETEFTVEEAKAGINGGSAVHDYLKDVCRGKVTIPEFALTVVNEGSIPLVYKLIRNPK